MIVKDVIRGNHVVFTANFLDVGGFPVTPPNPTLFLFYKSNRANVNPTFAMANGTGSNGWVASWNSSNVDANSVVYWHISAGGNTLLAMDGDFRVIANPSNPQSNT